MNETLGDIEHLDVLVVGAGLSGIAAGHHLQATAPWATYAIFEARGTIGGTWDLFRYPGIRSDSDMFTLGYSFRPWEGDNSIADGDSILRYIEATASEEGIDRHIRFHHRIVAADWSPEDSCWQVTVERSDTGETVEVTAGFLFSCTGYYRYDHGYVPEIDGMDRFTGTIVHPQHWPEDLGFEGRRVAVIGSGATAVTLIPALAGSAAHVTMVQRSPSYIAAMPLASPAARLFRKLLPRQWAGGAIRWFHALSGQLFYKLSRRRPQLVRKLLISGMRRELPPGYDIGSHFTPAYDPWDQRVCLAPEGDFFKAIRDGDVSVVTDAIESFTETGLKLVSGTQLDADIIVTATGLELLFAGGMEISVNGEQLDLPDKLTYRGMMLEDVPNFAMAVGYTNASWTLKCDLTCDFVARLLNTMRTRGVSTATPVNRDASVVAAPLLGLTSGYIQRSAHKFPRQGSRFPWQVHQSYLRDWWVLKRSGIDDGALVFGGTASDESASAAMTTARAG